MIRRLSCFCILWYLGYLPVFAAQIQAVTAHRQAQTTTLDFDLKGAFTHKLLVLANPDRVVVDFTDTSLAVNVNNLPLSAPIVKKVRLGHPDTKTLRLVLDIDHKAQVRSEFWRVQGKVRGIRVVLVDNGKPVAAAKLPKATVRPPTPISKDPIMTPHQPITVTHKPGNALRDVIVVLDAGHGGKDPGAKGPRRSQEKDVVLAITLKLKKLIDRQPGMRAVLTRSGDYYVGLRNRLDIARQYNGDIFVSIHADAFNNPNSHGASVFALSQSGATSEAARWIAEKENYSELGGVNLGELDDSNGVVRSVLIDLSQTSTINSSLQMGMKVLGQLNGFTNLHNNRVEQARFMVLKSPDIPSILVETGFISNPREERNLTSYAYQMRLTQAIFQGIKAYFWESPPHGTRIEAMTGNRLHLVKSGESLPRIAAMYSVPERTLRAANAMPNTQPKPGQKLVIPAWA